MRPGLTVEGTPQLQNDNKVVPVTETFLDIVPLPAYEQLPLAATAVRALERFSDVVDGLQRPAPLKVVDRFDIMDECLDLVIHRDDLPAGFEFTGLSLAQFWCALLAAQCSELQKWRVRLGRPDIAAMREAARKRIAIRPEAYWFLHSRKVKLPHCYVGAPLVELPDPLAALLQAADPDWKRPRRSRFTVEVIEEVCTLDRKTPTRGKRFPKPHWQGRLSWWRADAHRLQPRGESDDIEYFELQLALPSLESSYFSEHYPARNIFAHLRVTRFVDEKDRRILVLDEVQSDWLRDRRLQSRGRAIKERTVVKGERNWSPSDIPECPVAGHWLDIALRAFLEYAEESGCAAVAWVPGQIQHELNPDLPLSVAQSLYDYDVPETLSRLLDDEAEIVTVDYPTYRRSVLMQCAPVQGWLLVESDGKTPASEPVDGWEALHALFRARAIPAVEKLPAMMLPPWPQFGTPLDLEDEDSAVSVDGDH